jgi:enoyl-CoA hydratase
MAAEMDTRAHLSESTDVFLESVTRQGLKGALGTRDNPFGDGRARVIGPEIRDEHGNLVDPETVS